MSKIASRARDLSQKAAQLKAALEQAPATVAQVRETIANTSQQLQQLRAELQGSVNGLRASSQTSLSAALQEINADLPVYLEAGYEVSELDLEVSPVERLLVHLYKIDDVSEGHLRQLIAANTARRTTHAILTALQQARAAAEQVEMTNMHQAEVLIGIGPSPSVRLCWHSRAEAAPASVPPPLPRTVTMQAPAEPAPVPAATPATSPSLSSYSSSFFERRPAATPTSSRAPSLTPASDTAETAESAPATSPSGRDLLAKYKSSPHFSKYRR